MSKVFLFLESSELPKAFLCICFPTFVLSESDPLNQPGGAIKK